MQTRILPIDEKSLKLSEKIILNGGTVAFPTDTVYCVGANGFDGLAVIIVFKI